VSQIDGQTAAAGEDETRMKGKRISSELGLPISWILPLQFPPGPPCPPFPCAPAKGPN